MIIYKATNIINNHCYIGKTISSLSQRKRNHINAANNSYYDIYFHNALRKYGKDNFEWSILCETDTKSKLNALEKFYIATYRKFGKLYNMTDGGEGGLNPTNETRNKISKAHKGKKYSNETLKKMSIAATGRKLSDESRRKMSLSRTGKPSPLIGRKLSEETRNKIIKNHAFRGKKRPEHSIAMKGRFLGRKLSEETKNKISQSKMGKKLSEEHRLSISIGISGINNPFYGKHHSEETKRKLSEKRKGKFTGENNPNFGRRHSPEAIKIMSEKRKEYWISRKVGLQNA